MERYAQYRRGMIPAMLAMMDEQGAYLSGAMPSDEALWHRNFHAGLADLREGIASGQRATVYIKSIFPDRMKIKLVILDVGEPAPPPKRFDYFKKEGRLDRWVYSPPGCRKVIETVFV